MKNISKVVLGVATASVLALSLASPASARWHRGGAVAAGVATGLVAGAVIASQQPRYYGDSYYYDDSYAAPSYGYYDEYPQSSSQRYYQGRADTNTNGNW